MVTHSAPNADDNVPWEPHDYALDLASYGDGTDGRRPVVMAGHSCAPFIGEIGGGGLSNETALQRIAHDYLTALETRFAKLPGDKQEGLANGFLPDGWLEALNPASDGEGFRWIPIAAGQPAGIQKVTSRKMKRGKDQTVVLVAGDPFPSGFGVRVAMRVLDDTEEMVAITSMVAHLPSAPYITTLSLNRFDRVILNSIYAHITSNTAGIANAAGQKESEMLFHGLRLVDPDVLSLDDNLDDSLVLDSTTIAPLQPMSAWAPEKPAGAATVAAVTRWTLDVPTAKLIARWPVFSDAMFDAPVFSEDPASNKDLQDPPPYEFGSYRPSGELDDAREFDSLPADLETDDFIVRMCPDFVQQDRKTIEEGGDPNAPRRLHFDPDNPYDPRSDDQSAASAFHHCRGFFREVSGFGINTTAMFRRISRPLHVHYRSGVAPGQGKDGRTINARVALEVQKNGDSAPETLLAHVHFALANLNRWFRDVPDGSAFKARPAQPLGIANSRRWVHHELGHVLIAAALGELEFRFVHSVGDALAAVLADPTSRVSEADRTGAWEDFRFQTFPWVFANRRHDRPVITGWSWSGTMHLDVLQTPEIKLRQLKGYNSEQILSTTLFRLYRILGGDTHNDDLEPHVVHCRKASLVVLYLILRAIDSFAHPPLRAEELEAAMIEADVSLTSRLNSTVGEIWTGGQARKVIRWAFEAQGLHPPTNQPIAHNAPGAPPPVDLYIQDKRDGLEKTFAGRIDHGAGSYVPVSLHWDADANWVGQLDALGNIVIGNRGVQTVPGAKLRSWVGLSSGGNVSWITSLSKTQDLSAAIAPGTPIKIPLGIDLTQLSGFATVLLFVEVSAPQDCANTDPAAALACQIPTGGAPPTGRRELIDLVANDNNLGLFWLRLPIS